MNIDQKIVNFTLNTMDAKDKAKARQITFDDLFKLYLESLRLINDLMKERQEDTVVVYDPSRIWILITENATKTSYLTEKEAMEWYMSEIIPCSKHIEDKQAYATEVINTTASGVVFGSFTNMLTIVEVPIDSLDVSALIS